jgi:molybdenum cofactor cytidylyltransferase
VVTAVVLAAGEGRRVGGPKGLLETGGETFLSRVVTACRDGGCDAVIVVTAPPPDPTGEEAARAGARVVRNPDPARGMFSSVLLGLAAAEPGGVLVFPVDHPHVRAETVRGLLGAGRTASPDSWAVPLHEGRRGHPVWLGPGAVAVVRSRPSAGSLREALSGSPRIEVPTADPGVRRNVNLPSDLV